MNKFTNKQKENLLDYKYGLKGKINKSLALKAEEYYLSGKINSIASVYKIIKDLHHDTKRTESIDKLNKLQHNEAFREKKGELQLITSLEANKPTKLNRVERIINNMKQLTEHTERRKYDRKLLNGAFKEQILSGYLFQNKRKFNISESKFKSVIGKVLISNLLTDAGYNVSANLTIVFTMIKEAETGDFLGDNKITMYHYSKMAKKLTSPNQIIEWLKGEYDYFISTLEDLQASSSKLIFDSLVEIKVQTGRTKITRAGSYIELDYELKNKKCFINVKNKSNKCIIWALLACIHHKDEKIVKGKCYNEVKVYEEFKNEIIMPKGQKYPIDINKDIPKIEKLNNIKINIFYYAKDEYTNKYDYTKLNILRNTMERNDKVYNLLLVSDDENDHFVCISNIDALFRISKSDNKMIRCLQCLSKGFSSQEKLDEHLLLCNKHECVRTSLPKAYDPLTDDIEKRKDKMTFRNFNNTFMHPFQVIMDFEASLMKIDDDGLKRDKDTKEILKDKNGNELKNQTIKINKHVVNSCGLIYDCIHEEYNEEIKIINNKDPNKVMEETILELERLALKSYNLIEQHKATIILTDEEKIIYKNCSSCASCKTKFEDGNKVRHHDHISGKYISALCKKCNLGLQYKKFLPVYLHNLKGYDSHFIVPALNSFGYKHDKSDNISCIPSTEEKYISFSKEIKVGEYMANVKILDKETKEVIRVEKKLKNIMFEIRFIDTLGFMATSLDKLTENLKDGCKSTAEKRIKFKKLSKHFTNDLEFNLMCSKGVYPYEYIDNYYKLYDKQLPPIECFYSRLNDSYCSEKDYEIAKLVWKTFKCKTMLDYHNLYLSSDVLLLSDIWGNFRQQFYNIHGLDCDYYYTAPGMSWDAFLKHTNEYFMEKYGKPFEIDLLTDIDMYLLMENNIRGGLSQVSKRYAMANNKYVEGYDKTLMDSYLLYLDANNLYGLAMCSYLPYKDFKWCEEKWTNDKDEIDYNKILALEDKGNIGYLFDVNLTYPKELHDLHNGYALACENICVKNDMLNAWQTENRKDAKITKLCTSFNDKINYGVNYRELKFFIQKGLIITKINRVLQYEQLNIMESYIMKNTECRKKATNDFEKDFFKLLNNSIFGKSMENTRKRINFRLLSSQKEAEAVRNTRIRITAFTDELVGIHLLKQEVQLNKPIFIGQNILDESKLIMQKFHYNFMLPKFGKENLDLLFTDTDSLCYHIKNIDPYNVMLENKDEFDLASYPKDSILYDPKNNKVPGAFKDELAGKYMKEGVFLRSKLNSYITSEGITKKTCKGVKQSVVKNNICFDDFKSVLFERTTKEVEQYGFRSHHHNIYTEKMSKNALSGNDDKCFILDDNITTLTLGHYRIKEIQKLNPPKPKVELKKTKKIII